MVKEFLMLMDFIAIIIMVATVAIKTYSTGSLGVPFSQRHYFVYFVAIRQCYYSTFTY